MDPPRRVLKRARAAIDECKRAFNVREVPKRVVRARKDEHVRARDEDEDVLQGLIFWLARIHVGCFKSLITRM